MKTPDQLKEDLLRKFTKITPFERMTVKMMSETGIEKAVRRLRDEEGTVGRLAGRLVARWLTKSTPPRHDNSSELVIIPPSSKVWNLRQE